MSNNDSNRCLSPVWTTLPLLGQGFFRCKDCGPCKRNMVGEGDRAMQELRNPKYSWNRFPHRQINFVMYHARRFFR